MLKCSIFSSRLFGTWKCSILSSRLRGMWKCSILRGRLCGIWECSILSIRLCGMWKCSILSIRQCGMWKCCILSSRLCGTCCEVREMRCYLKILHISYKDHVTNEEVRAKIQQAIGPHEDLLTIVKRRKLQWYGHVSRSSGLA